MPVEVFTLLIHVRKEKWPRDEEAAARYVARAANAVRKHLLDFKHADVFTCRAYLRQIGAYLRNGGKRQLETFVPDGRTSFDPLAGARSVRPSAPLRRKLL